MSAASVRASGRRDNFPIFRTAAGKRREPGSLPRPVALRYWSRISSSLWWTGSSFSLPFSLNRSKNLFPEGIIVFDLQVLSAALTARSAYYPYRMHQTTGDFLSQILQADLDHAL